MFTELILFCSASNFPTYYNNSPEFKKQRELFDEAQARLQTYTNSPAFKKLYEETVKNAQAMNGSYNTYTDTAT